MLHFSSKLARQLWLLWMWRSHHVLPAHVFWERALRNSGNYPSVSCGLALATWLPNSGNLLFKHRENLNNKKNDLVKSGQKSLMTKSLIAPNVFLDIKPLILQASRRGTPGLEIKSTPTCEQVFLSAELRVSFFLGCQEVVFRQLGSPFERNHHRLVWFAQHELTSTHSLGGDRPSPQLCHQPRGSFVVWPTSDVFAVYAEIPFSICSKTHWQDAVLFAISYLSRDRLFRTHQEEALAP